MNTMILVLTPSGRYHNGAGYTHHPAFGIDVHWLSDAQLRQLQLNGKVAHGCIDISELDGQDTLPLAKAATLAWMREDPERFIRILDQELDD